MPATYDTIGRAYAKHRGTDPRLAAAIWTAIGDANTVVNVGAGTGSYEPPDCRVVGVEPSSIMVAQRPAGSAPAVQASAEALPFRNAAFDAAMAILTMQHWSDWRRGIKECARVARWRVVLFSWDPDSKVFWLVQEYFPEILALDQRIFPNLAEISAVLGDFEMRAVPIPADCADGFLGAFWRRPEAYLDQAVRTGISSFGRIADATLGLARLQRDLASGEWKRRHADLLERADLDIGYRLIVADRS